MKGYRLRRLLDAISAGRRPKSARATPEDAEVVRAAIMLRSARPGLNEPSDAFVENLFRDLAKEAAPEPERVVRPARMRGRTALVSAAAAIALVTATAVTTEALSGATGTSAASQVPSGSQLRTGTFTGADGSVLGQIAAFRGDHSWVFMNVGIPHYEGRVTCMLQNANGTTVAFGTFIVRDGMGQFSKAIDGVNVSRLRGANLVSASGQQLAVATFAA